MPLYAAARTGVCCLVPGDSMTLFDGTETVAVGTRSIPFARGITGSDNPGKTVQVTGLGAASTVSFEGANVNGSSAALWTSVSGDLTPDTNGTVSYWDPSQFAFYSAKITALGGGEPTPVVTVQC